MSNLLKVSLSENDLIGIDASQVQGTAVDGAAAVGNPVQVGGVDENGDAQALLTETTGALVVSGATEEGVSAFGLPFHLVGGRFSGDGTAYPLSVDDTGIASVQDLTVSSAVQFVHQNVIQLLLAETPRTATTQSADQTNQYYRSLTIFANVAAQSGGSMTLSLQFKDPTSSNYFTVWTAAAALTAVGLTTYAFGPGISGGLFTEVLAFGLQAYTWRVVATHNNGSSITYAVTAILVP